MSFDTGKNYAKAVEEDAKAKLRKQMHHDLCVLAAGCANPQTEVITLDKLAHRAMETYKALWHQVMKEIP